MTACNFILPYYYVGPGEGYDAKTRVGDEDFLTLILVLIEAGRAMTASLLFTILNKGEFEHMCLILSPWRLACHSPPLVESDHPCDQRLS